jgi:cell division inhibitor SepF
MSLQNKLKEFFGFTEENEEGLGYPTLSQKTEEKTSPLPTQKAFKASLVNANNSHFPANEINVHEPRIYEDSLNIATQLRDNVPVIVNLKYLDADTSKRLIDFVCGTAYAINGHMMKIGENIFLFTPSNIFIANTEDKSTFEKGVAQQEKNIFFDQVSSM